ncbi:MAG: twin-arginine translocase TatA/TatE family subunit [Chloroflexi bacterium]|nr:twin-arginine translocase TatA/TatE family subunit [Chloroflexota bacterium]
MDFLGIGPVEVLAIALVAFLFLGPARMMEVARSLGKIVQEVKRTTSDLPSLISLDEPNDQPPSKRFNDTTQE